MLDTAVAEATSPAANDDRRRGGLGRHADVPIFSVSTGRVSR
jgi:hypothetical protein